MVWRSVKVTIASLALAWLAALSVVGWLVLNARDVAIEKGQRATAAFAAVVEQQVVRTLQATYLTLGAIADAQQMHSPPAINDPEFQHMMSRRVRDVPFVRALYIIGKDGWITHDTDYPNTPRVSLSDRPYFVAYANGTVSGPEAWPPLLSRSGTGWFVPVTYPVSSGAGFQGVVVAAVQAAHFAEEFRAAFLPDGDVVSLFHENGVLIATFPNVGEVGRNYGALPTFAHMRSSAGGTFQTDFGLVPRRSWVSYRKVNGAPLVVRVSRDEADGLAEWRRSAIGAAFAMAALTVALAAIVARVTRDSVRESREREVRVQREKLEALGQLSSGVTHDFANLLNDIGMNVKLLRMKYAEDKVREHALAAMERALESGRRVSERLLMFARRKPLTLTPVRVDEWLDAALPLLRQAVGSRIQLTVETEESLPEVLCDVGELDVMLLNLVVNARDALAGSGHIDIRAVRCEEYGGLPRKRAGGEAPFVCVTVRDDGPGMSEEVRRRALEPFYTTKGDAGTGLGLSQVYGVIDQLGGQMTIDSAPGRGTSIHLFLPIESSGTNALADAASESQTAD